MAGARRIIGFGGLLTAATLIALSAACGSGSGKDRTATASPVNVEPTADLASAPTPVPAPIVNGSHVDSDGVGYEASVPSGWHLRANVLSSDTYRGDAYFAPDNPTPDPARPPANITVGCQAQQGGVTLDQVVQDDVEALTSLRRENVRVSDHAPVASLPARQVDYIFRLTAPEVPEGAPTPLAGPNIVLERRDVLFVSNTCVWSVTLGAPVGALKENTAVLEELLTAFKVK